MPKAESTDVKRDVEIHGLEDVASRCDTDPRDVSRWALGISPVPWWVVVDVHGQCHVSEDV